jgi:hypothetical protein
MSFPPHFTGPDPIKFHFISSTASKIYAGFSALHPRTLDDHPISEPPLEINCSLRLSLRNPWNVAAGARGPCPSRSWSLERKFHHTLKQTYAPRPYACTVSRTCEPNLGTWGVDVYHPLAVIKFRLIGTAPAAITTSLFLQVPPAAAVCRFRLRRPSLLLFLQVPTAAATRRFRLRLAVFLLDSSSLLRH